MLIKKSKELGINKGMFEGLSESNIYKLRFNLIRQLLIGSPGFDFNDLLNPKTPLAYAFFKNYTMVVDKNDPVVGNLSLYFILFYRNFRR